MFMLKLEKVSTYDFLVYLMFSKNENERALGEILQIYEVYDYQRLEFFIKYKPINGIDYSILEEKLKSVKSNKGKEIKIFYNTIQRKEGYIEQAESFIDKITNTLAPIIPSKDNDIPKKEDVKKSSIEVFRENSSIVEKIEEEVISYYDNDFNLDDLNNL